MSAGLLALTGCGGGGGTPTQTLTAATSSSVPAATGGSTAGTGAMGPVAIAAAADEAPAGVGAAVLAPAALAGAAKLPGKTATSAPAPVPTHQIKNGASGQFAVAHTNGTFKRPTQIVLKVAASPSQSGTVFWAIVCAESSGHVGHKQAQSTMQLPTTETLSVPTPSKYCNASANVQLSRSGTVTISLTG